MERDEETGLALHGVRFYAPWLARWASADPSGMADGPNRYAYTRGSPVGSVDTDGRGTKTADLLAGTPVTTPGLMGGGTTELSPSGYRADLQRDQGLRRLMGSVSQNARNQFVEDNPGTAAAHAFANTYIGGPESQLATPLEDMAGQAASVTPGHGIAVSAATGDPTPALQEAGFSTMAMTAASLVKLAGLPLYRFLRGGGDEAIEAGARGLDNGLDAVDELFGGASKASRGAARADLGTRREARVAELIGGRGSGTKRDLEFSATTTRTSRRGRTIAEVEGSKVDLLSPTGDHVHVGGPAKMDNPSKFKETALRNQRVARAHGQEAHFYFEDTTPTEFLDQVKGWVGTDFVHTFSMR